MIASSFFLGLNQYYDDVVSSVIHEPEIRHRMYMVDRV